MRGGAFALAALLAALPMALAAKAPLTSPRPLMRDVAAADVVLDTTVPTIRPKPRAGMLVSTMVAEAAGPKTMTIRPRARPETASRSAEIGRVAARASLLVTSASARPEARPENLGQMSLVQTVAFVPGKATGVLTSRKGSVCGDPAIKGTTIPPIVSRVKGCGLEDGVKVTSVAGVKLTVPAEIDCTTAKALKSWVEDSAIPAVGKRGGGLEALQVAGSYACRPRNNVRGAKISEHGSGRAIDIGGYILANGTSVSVLKGWGSEASGKILASMRKNACGPFNTVLGPGSDSHHRDHLHFDTARGRGPYCH